MTHPPPFDLALVGGGLQNGLIALAVLAARPTARIALFERGPRLGGNHTWCFHQGDLDAAQAAWVDPLIAHRWPGYDVAFTGYRRALASPYACVTAERLDEVVRARLAAAPGAALYTDTEVVALGPGRLAFRRGGGVQSLRAHTVVDARGPDRARGVGGWQKFVGIELELTAPHGLATPLLMDATVEQVDGSRFVYVLPLGPRRLLVEDTCFSEIPALDGPRLLAQARAYVAARGWKVAAELREERGVLPLYWQTSVTPPAQGLISAGYQGGWFHPVTGYSFPPAARVAAAIGRAIADDTDPAAAVAALVPEHERQLRFAMRLVWMMFKWFPPERRIGVLEHFYRLPEDTIRRFYGLASTNADRTRMFLGRPPRGLSWRAIIAAAAPPASPLTEATS